MFSHKRSQPLMNVPFETGWLTPVFPDPAPPIRMIPQAAKT
jgi:hypothetical protein